MQLPICLFGGSIALNDPLTTDEGEGKKGQRRSEDVPVFTCVQP